MERESPDGVPLITIHIEYASRWQESLFNIVADMGMRSTVLEGPFQLVESIDRLTYYRQRLADPVYQDQLRMELLL